jgi:hypothetical protein
MPADLPSQARAQEPSVFADQAGRSGVRRVQHALTMLTSAGALQTAVPDAIVDRLGELGELLADADPARNRRIFTSLQELEGHLDGLRNNTKQFNGELPLLLSVPTADQLAWLVGRISTSLSATWRGRVTM